MVDSRTSSSSEGFYSVLLLLLNGILRSNNAILSVLLKYYTLIPTNVIQFVDDASIHMQNRILSTSKLLLVINSAKIFDLKHQSVDQFSIGKIEYQYNCA